jgi:limonene-1,2-epoxide hydrolase
MANAKDDRTALTSMDARWPQTDETRVVLRFIDHFNANRIDAALELLDENVFYHNIPMEPIRGREDVRAFTYGFGVGTAFRAEWQIVYMAAHGDVVLTERMDVFHAKGGGRIAIPLMGAFRVRDGFIAEWRDYFDLGDFTRQLEALHNPS